MFRKSLAWSFTAFFSLMMIGVDASTGAGNNTQPLAATSSVFAAQNACSDQAIHDKVVAGIKQGFAPQKRAENFHFIILVKDKMVTIKGWVPGDDLRNSVIRNVTKTLKEMNCQATLNPVHVLFIKKKPPQKSVPVPDAKNGSFRNNKGGSCPDGKVECPTNGECKDKIEDCPVNEVG